MHAGAEDQKTLRDQQAAKLAQSGEMGPAQHDWMHHFARPRFVAPTPAAAPGGALVTGPKEEPVQLQSAGQELLSLHGPVRRQSYPPPHEDHGQVRVCLVLVTFIALLYGNRCCVLGAPNVRMCP